MDAAEMREWKNFEKRVTEKWFGLDPRLQRMYPADRHISKRCPYVPRSLQEYAEHCLEFLALQERRCVRITKTYQEDQKARQGHDRFIVTSIGDVALPYPPPTWTEPWFGRTPFGYRNSHIPRPQIFTPEIFDHLIHDNPTRSAVLAQHTIWNYDPFGERLTSTRRWISPWPCAAELSHEGNERVNTENGRFGRCVPLARIPTYASISWQVTPRAPEFPLDALYDKLPHYESIYQPVDEIEDEKVGDLLDQSLLDALDIKTDEFVIKARSTYLGTLFPALVPFPGPMPPRDMTPEERHLYQMLVPWCPPTVLLPSREASPEPAYVLQPAPVQEPVWMPQPAPAPEPAWRPEPAPVVVRLPPQGPMRQVEPAVATSKMTNSVINPLAPAFLPSPTSNKPTVQPHAPCFIPRNLQRPHYSPPPTPQVRASVVSNDSLQQKNVIDFGPIAPPKKKESTPIPIRSRETEHIQPVPQRPPELVTAVKSWIQQIDDRVEDTLENLASLVLSSWLPFLAKENKDTPPARTNSLSQLLESLQPKVLEILQQVQQVLGIKPDLPASPPTRLESLRSALQKYSPDFNLTALKEDPSAVLGLALLLTIVFYMASWFGRTSSWGSRFSPFGRPSANNTGEVSDADFSYITSDDLAKHNVGGSSKQDVLLCKHKKVHYPLHFPAGYIDRGDLRVGQIKAALAQKMDLGASGADRVTLYYSGKNLKEDARLARDVGLKSGVEAELLVEVGPATAENDDEDDDEEEAGAADGTPAKRKRNRNKKKKGKKNLDSGTATPNSGTATPNPDATFVPSYAPPPKPAASTPKPAAAPQTAMQKLEALSSTFHTKFVPECVKFTSNPPADKAKRAFDHKRLEETMMQQILLKLDAVETDGDPDARAKRKALVREVDSMMKALDDADK